MDFIDFSFTFLKGLRRRKEKQKERAVYKKTNDEVSALRRRYRLTKDAINRAISKVLFSFVPIQIAWEFTNILIENPKVKIKKLRIVDPGEYASKTNIVEPGQIRDVCIPSYYKKSDEKIEKYETPDISVYAIRNASIVGQTNIVLPEENNAVISEVYMVSEGRANISYGYLVGIYKDKAYYADNAVKEEIDKGINLVHPGSYNFYHFAIEVLSRIIVADCVSEYRNYPLLVDEVVKTVPAYTWLLEKTRGNHEVIWISANSKYKVNELIYPSAVTWMPANYLKQRCALNKDFVFSKNILKKLKGRIEEKLCLSNKHDRCIYLSRRDLTNSRLDNEKDVEDIFEQAGFEIIHPEEFSVEEQISIFHEAKYVVGVSGGALTNIIYCQPGTVLACIIPQEYQFHMYATIAKNLGLDCKFINATIEHRTDYNATDTFKADLEQIKELAFKFSNGTDY